MDLFNLILENEKWRNNCLNMVVSENVLSPRVKKALSIQHSRYHANFYGGTQIFREIFEKTITLAKDVFRCSSAIISPLSGNLAVIAVIFALTQPKDKIAILPLSPGGGYPINLEFFDRIRIDIPFNPDKYNIDISQTLELIEREKPKLIFLGASLFPFPHPVQHITKKVHEYGGIVAYDGSHVLGLIAGEQFQDPLREGADLLIGSTHKTFPGPQGGVILSNNYCNEELEEVIGIDPLKGIILVDNIHNSRIAALGIALDEFQMYGKAYAHQIVKNSRTLAKVLDQCNIPIHGKKYGFTESHQVLMKIKDFEEGARYRDALLGYSIITDAGMRFGTAELTRLGFLEQEMDELGMIIAQILNYARRSKNISNSDSKMLKERIKFLILRKIDFYNTRFG